MFLDNTPLLLAIATFVALVLLYGAVSSLIGARRRQRGLLNRTRRWSEAPPLADDLESPAAGSKKATGRHRFRLFGGRRRSGDTGIYADTPLFYQRAGIYNPGSIRSYRVVRFLLLLAPVCLLIGSHVLYYRPFNGVTLLVVFLAGYLGYFLPVFWLRILAHYRKKELNRTFPDALDLLMVCVEAGLGIDAAIRRVSREIHITSPELAKELKILSLELKTGLSRNSCLKNLARRTNLPDVDNLVSLLIQADKYGTGVAHALKIHAEEMRQKRYGRLEELAAKLPVKLTVPLILFIFPAFFVVIAGPAAIQVLRKIIQG